MFTETTVAYGDVMSYVAHAGNLSESSSSSSPPSPSEAILAPILWNATMFVPTATSATNSLDVCRFIGAVVISMPLIVLGVLANSFAFVVLCCQRQRLSTCILLQTLAVVDTVVLLLSLLLKALPALATHTGAHSSMKLYMEMYSHIRAYLYPFMYFTRLANTWMTVLISVNRYIAVCRPRSRLARAPTVYLHIAIVFILSAVFSIPRWFEYSFADGFMRSTALVRDRRYIVGYRIVVFSAIMYLIPMTILILLSGRLCRQLHHMVSCEARDGQTRALTTDRSRLRDTTKSTTIVVVTLVSICVICNLAAFVSHLLWSLHTSFAWLQHIVMPRRYMSIISNIMVTFNSAINFFIYCTCSRSFRKACVNLLVKRWKTAVSGNSSVQTTNSNVAANPYSNYPLQNINSH